MGWFPCTQHDRQVFAVVERRIVRLYGFDVILVTTDATTSLTRLSRSRIPMDYPIPEGHLKIKKFILGNF